MRTSLAQGLHLEQGRQGHLWGTVTNVSHLPSVQEQTTVDGRRQYLEGEARWLLQAAGLTIEASEEGEPGSWLWSQGDVMVQKLTPLHEYERAFLVPGQLIVGEAHDGIGDLASLQQQQKSLDA